MAECLNCSIYTKNPKFCGSSCAAKYNNRKFPKRRRSESPKLHPERPCKKCGGPTSLNRKKCEGCIKASRYSNLTLEAAIYKHHHRSSAFAFVRSKAREVARELKWSRCRVCGYSLHTEVCHRRPISSYPPDTLVKVINSPENLAPLCRNCHWEIDHGITAFPE